MNKFYIAIILVLSVSLIQSQLGLNSTDSNLPSFPVNRIEAEYQTLNLDCNGKQGYTIEYFSYASYGNSQGSVSKGFIQGSCHAKDSVLEFIIQCLGKSQCEISASNDLFKDPCVGTFKSLAASYVCQQTNKTNLNEFQVNRKVAEHQTLNLDCQSKANFTIEKIVYASYGLNTGDEQQGWGQYTTKYCKSATSLEILQNKCIGKASCSIQAVNGVFGDPCYGWFKSLAASYVCRYTNSLQYANADMKELGYLTASLRNQVESKLTRYQTIDYVYDKSKNLTAQDQKQLEIIAMVNNVTKEQLEQLYKYTVDLQDQLNLPFKEARYVRVIRDQGSSCLQISQIQVFNAQNQEVAKGKKASASSQWEAASSPSRAVDGEAANRNHPNEFHIGGGQCGDKNAWWEVDLGENQLVSKIVYYNRRDCCSDRSKGMLVQLLDKNRGVIGQQRLQGGMVETLNFQITY